MLPDTMTSRHLVGADAVTSRGLSYLWSFGFVRVTFIGTYVRTQTVCSRSLDQPPIAGWGLRKQSSKQQQRRRPRPHWETPLSLPTIITHCTTTSTTIMLRFSLVAFLLVAGAAAFAPVAPRVVKSSPLVEGPATASNFNRRSTIVQDGKANGRCRTFIMVLVTYQSS